MTGVNKNSWTVFLISVILIGSLFSCQREKNLPPSDDAKASQSGSKEISNGQYEDLEGNPIQLSDYKGKKILLHFWATWCRPCIEEMPSLTRVQPLLEKENYLILLVSEESVDEIKAFQKRRDPGLTLLRYSEALSQLNIYALPTTYVLNEDGEKIKEISGRMDWDSEQTISELINLH